MALLREFCAENVERVPAAIEAGARRIELCDNLAVGGTTPSHGVIRAAVEYARPRGADVMVMIRPRGGDFEYSDAERAIMLDDLAVARELGPTGVVFGCTRDGRLDRKLTAELLEAAGDLQVTFHMAFDAIDESEQLEAIDWLAEHGATRILTHGGAAGTAIEDNLDRLRAYVERAAGRIAILPGAGVTWRNAESVADALGVAEVHGTKIVRLD